MKNNAVHHIPIPQYEGLSIEDMLTFLRRYPALGEYFPEERDIHKLPKKWIADIGFTIVGDDFGKWVKT